MIFLLLIGVILVWLMLAAYFTNPFSSLSIIKRPYVVHIWGKTLRAVNNNDRLKVRQRLWWRVFAIVKCGVHILHTRYISSPRSRGADVEAIIRDIHALRFNPQKLLLISGDHFNGLFVRNLGVFYYPTLDARISGDWQHRQAVYLQTVAYALGVFSQRPIPVTTIVPTGGYRATCVNFYAYPSDTIYGILYALAALVGDEKAAPDAYAPVRHTLQTVQAARELRARYMPTLQSLYEHYRHKVFDDAAGLVRKDLHLSGAKDITRRASAFYDNVIFWKTTQLAMRFGLIPEDKLFLSALKKRIIATFWLEQEGYFLEDLSKESMAHAYYSSDWLIVLATGFLHPARKQDRPYFTRSISYIQAQNIDQPFALKYQAATRAHRQFWAVRLAVASYGGDAIWSFWGMEYIKTLLLLYKATGEGQYLTAARQHIHAYKMAMIKNGGFPEVYDADGTLLQTPLYRSIRQTGWVIGFEQVLAMYKAIVG